MAAERKAQGGVIGNELFALAGSGQGHGRFADRCVQQQIALHRHSRHRPGRLAAMSGQRVQRSGCRQPVQVLAAHAGPSGEIGDVAKWPCRCDAFPYLLAQSLDLAQPEPNDRAIDAFQSRIPGAKLNIRGFHFDPMTSRILDQLRGRIKPHRLRVEQSGQKGSRLMALEPRRDIGQQGKTRCMRFRETVFAKTFDLAKDRFGEFL